MDMQNLFGKMQQMQQQMQQVKAEIAKLETSADTGGGAVKVTATGDKRIVKIDIDADIMDDKEMVEDLVVAAVNRAIEKAEEMSAEKMKEVTKGMMPNMPGMDLSQLGL